MKRHGCYTCTCVPLSSVSSKQTCLSVREPDVTISVKEYEFGCAAATRTESCYCFLCDIQKVPLVQHAEKCLGSQLAVVNSTDKQQFTSIELDVNTEKHLWCKAMSSVHTRSVAINLGSDLGS